MLNINKHKKQNLNIKPTLNFKNSSRLCAYHCAQLSYKTQHRTVAIITAALRSRCGHYIIVLFLSFFFPRLISAVADWMTTILRHMMWS